MDKPINKNFEPAICLQYLRLIPKTLPYNRLQTKHIPCSDYTSKPIKVKA